MSEGLVVLDRIVINKKIKRRWGIMNIISKYFFRIPRYFGFLMISLFFRWPIWFVLFLLKPFKTFDYIFLVYPGTESDLDGYCPRWLAKSWLFSCKPTIGGIITKGSCGRGLYLVVPNTAKQLQEDKNVCIKIMARLGFIRNLIGAKSIAVAGQGPSMFAKHGISISQPFVRGNKGTVFCVIETIEQVMKAHSLVAGKFKIAVVGVGYVGSILIDFLKSQGHNIIGLDIEEKENAVKINEGADVLRNAEMVVVLTPKGSDFVPHLPRLKNGCIIIDDTHPKIRVKDPNGHNFYKVTVGLESVNFYPRLPGFKKDWIPGCALEAMYSAATNDYNGTPQAIFNKRAKEMGFYAHLVR